MNKKLVDDILGIISEKLSEGKEEITLDMTFDTLAEKYGADSLDFVEIAMDVEDYLGIEGNEPSYELKLGLNSTVQHFVDLYKEWLQ